MSDDSGDSINKSNKSTAPENISSNEETISKACILLAESKPDGMPSRLQLLCDCLIDKTPVAFITAALQLLMLECGFMLPQAEITHEEAPLKFTSDLAIPCESSKDGRTQSFIFTLREVSGCECKLMITTMNNVLLVNSFIVIPIAAYSVVIPIEYYFPRPDASTLYEKYDHLDELSLTFKNSVATPARAAILVAKGIPAASLLGLPLEILNKIFKYCGPINVCNVAQTCRAMSASAKDQRLWYFFFNFRFPDKVVDIRQRRDVDWVKEYQSAFEHHRKTVSKIHPFKTLRVINYKM